jgi:hypothetical protein
MVMDVFGLIAELLDKKLIKNITAVSMNVADALCYDEE